MKKKFFFTLGGLFYPRFEIFFNQNFETRAKQAKIEQANSERCRKQKMTKLIFIIEKNL